MTVEDRAQQQLAFGQDYSGPDAQAPRSYVVRDGERVIAHALVFARTIRTTAGEMTIAALARVCSDPTFRGQGLGEAVVRAAFAAVDRGRLRVGRCSKPARRCGRFTRSWVSVLVENPIINSLAEGPKTNPFWDEVAMRYPAQGDWPSGTIDLRGPGY